jgi:N-acetylglutamate synthase
VDGTAPHGQIRIALRDVGSRVVVRYRLPGHAHGPFGESLSDVVGDLLSWPADESGDLVVARRSGEQVRVPLASVVAAKPLPPLPPTRSRQADGNAEER